MSFDRAVAFVLKWEGGEVNDSHGMVAWAL